MEIQTIHSFLVHAGKHLDPQPKLRGTPVPKKGKMYEMLQEIFDEAERVCIYDIKFFPDDEAVQKSEVRDEIIAYTKAGHIKEARVLAGRLQQVTTNRSGLGLFFLILGADGSRKKLVASRFPADSGILAEEKGDNLTVEFLERVFMKSETHYKSAVWSGTSFDKDFWKGKAIDKQRNVADRIISDYWIHDFLRSEFLTPGAAATQRLAVSVRTAMNKSDDPKVKAQLVALAELAPAMNGKATSAEKLLGRFNVAAEAVEAVRTAFKPERLFKEQFQFDGEVFSRHLAFRTLQLNNSAVLSAPIEKFGEVFQQEFIGADGKVVKFTTQGEVVDQRFGKTSP